MRIRPSCIYANATTPKQCAIIHYTTLIVLLPTLLLLILPLHFLAFLVALLRPELFFPQLARGLAIEAREHNVADVTVPYDGLAFDAGFDILYR